MTNHEHNSDDQTMPSPSDGAEPTTPLHTGAASPEEPTTPTSSPPGESTPVAADPAQTEPEWIRGPSSSTLLAGLLTVVVAALAIVRLATDVDLDWTIAVPVSVIAVGLIAVVLGVASFSRRSRPALHESRE